AANRIARNMDAIVVLTQLDMCGSPLWSLGEARADHPSCRAAKLLHGWGYRYATRLIQVRAVTTPAKDCSGKNASDDSVLVWAPRRVPAGWTVGPPPGESA